MRRLNLALLFSFVMSILSVGCDTVPTKPSEDGPFLGDPILFHAQNTLPVLHKTVQGVLAWELENRALLQEKAPGVTRFADGLRRDFPPAMVQAVRAVDAYKAALKAQKAGGPPPDATAMNDALALVDRLAQAALTIMLENRSIQP
jgi:hypothetical protein